MAEYPVSVLLGLWRVVLIPWLLPALYDSLDPLMFFDEPFDEVLWDLNDLSFKEFKNLSE